MQHKFLYHSLESCSCGSTSTIIARTCSIFTKCDRFPARMCIGSPVRLISFPEIHFELFFIFLSLSLGVIFED